MHRPQGLFDVTAAAQIVQPDKQVEKQDDDKQWLEHLVEALDSVQFVLSFDFSVVDLKSHMV